VKYRLMKTLIAATAFAAASLAQADAGTFGSFVSVDGSWYQGNNPGTKQLASLAGANFGSFAAGSGATLDNAEILTWKNSGGDVTGATLYWSVDGGAYQAVALGFEQNNPVTDPAGNTYDTGGNQVWGGLSQAADFLQGLTVGSHSLNVYLTADTTSGVQDQGSAVQPFTANFTVSAVPEPSSLALLAAGLGGVGLVVRRRRVH